MGQKGGIKLSVVIAATLGIGFGASVFLNYQQYQRAQADQRLMQGEITDLRYQVKQDQLAAGSSPSPSPSASPSASATPTPMSTPSPSPAVAGAAAVDIAMYGVKLTANDPIMDLAYGKLTAGAGFTTQTLLAKYPACKPGATALGTLTRHLKTQAHSSREKFVKTIGNFTYYYIEATGNCVTDQAGRDALVAARVSLKNSALPTLSQ